MSRPSFTVDASELDHAAKVLERSEPVFAKAIRPAIRASVNVVRKNVRQELRPHRRTGRMASNVRARVRGAGINVEGGVRATGSGANLIVGGVKEHDIAPGRVMPMWEGRGAWRGGQGKGITGFHEAVHHPGFPPDPFFHRGVLRSMGEIEANNRHAIAAAADELAHQIDR